MTKQQMIVEAIRSQIQSGHLRGGEMIPSYSALMEQFGVARGTVRQALNILKHEGLVEPLPSKGTVVVDPNTRWDMLGLAILGHPSSPQLMEALRLLQGQLAEHRCDIAVRFVGVEETDLSDLVEWGKRLDGIMLAGWVTVGAIDFVAKGGLEPILIGMPVDGECPSGVSWVTPNVAGTMRYAMGLLVGLGHQRITFVNRKGTYYQDVLSATFHEEAQLHGVNASVHNIRWDNDYDPHESDLPGLLDQMPAYPTALLVDGAMLATRLMQHLERAEWSIPGQLSVMALSGGAVADGRVRDDLTCIETSPQNVVIKAAEIAHKLARETEKTVYVEKLPARFFRGKTCRALRD